MVVRVPLDVEDEEQNSKRNSKKRDKRTVENREAADLRCSQLATIQDDGIIVANGSGCVDSSSLLQ